MKIGPLRHRLTLEKYTSIPDETGYPVKTWKKVADIWGQIMPVNGREAYTEEQIRSLATNLIYIRYREGLQPDMRLTYQGRIFLITAILEDGLKSLTKLQVTEVLENEPKD